MKWKECKALILSDWQRFSIHGKNGNLYFLYAVIRKVLFKVPLYFRLGTYLKSKNDFFHRFLLLLVRLRYKRLSFKTGIQVPIGTTIGSGLRFFHYGSIVIASSTIIGNNVSIHQDVTIGRVFSGKRAGVPVIGNNVVIFSGAKIIGNVLIGDNSVIGANAVVINDVPNNSVAAGVPARVVSNDSNKCFDQYWLEEFSRN